MQILIPCKGIGAGKSRLRDCLEERDHRALCEHLVSATLDTAVRTAGADNVWIVTSDDEASAIARRFRVRRIAHEGRGLNADLERSRTMLLSGLAEDTEILVLPIDLPFVQPDILEEMADCGDDLVIAPDERRTGTNALLLRAEALRCVPFAYGPGSFAAHVGAARRLNLAIRVIDHWRLAFDIDEPAQYARWAQPCDQLSGIMHCS